MLEGQLIKGLVSSEILTGGEDPKAANSLGQPKLVAMQSYEEITIVGGRAHCVLPPLSFAAMTFELE